MKKVLFVAFSLYNGGAERSLVNLLNEFPKGKYEVDLLLFRKEGMFLPQIPSWINIIETPDKLKKFYSPLTNSGEFILRKILGTLISRRLYAERGKSNAWRWKKVYSPKVDVYPTHYDVVISYTSGEVMYFVADKIQADKKIVMVHNDYRQAKHPKEFEVDYFKRFYRILSISTKCVDILKEEFPELSDRMYCVENITSSIAIKKRAEEFVPFEYSRQAPSILSIGRLMEQKGFDMAVDATKILKERGVSFRWYIIGNGELEEKIKERIKSDNVSDCFYLLGAKENPYPYIANCTVFAQTSRFEGKSVVLDEAKILCKPIVVTNYPTVKDQIEDGKEGIIVSMTPEAIAAGIERMLTDISLRERIEKYLADHEYGNQDEVQKYMDLIDA